MQINHLTSTLNQVPSEWVGKILSGMAGVREDTADTADARTRAEKILARIAAYNKTLTFLPLAESYTEETPEMRRAYRVMLRDATVKASVLTKLMAVCQLDPQVHPASDRPIDQDASEFIRHAITKCKGGTRRMLANILLPALLEGYSVNEKVWGVEDRGRWTGKYKLKELKAKDSEFVDLEVDEFRNVTWIKDKRTQQRWHPSNFVIYSHMPLFESPTGMSDLRAAYRAYWLMDTSWKLRAVALERFTLPMLMGTYATDDQKLELEAMLAAARAQSWVSLPQGALIEAVELASKGTSDFQAAINDLKEEIALGITGAVLQMLQGQVADGRGSSSVHKSTAELLQWWLAAEAGDVITDQLVPDLVTFNFAAADFPTVTFGGVNDSALTSSLTVDQGLHGIGLALSRKEMYKRYGRSEPVDDDDAIAPQVAPGAGPLGIAAGGNYAGMPFAEGQPADPKAQAEKSKTIRELQASYFKGEVTRDAAMANARIALGLTAEDAEALFPLVTDDDVTKASEAAEPAWLLDLPDVRQQQDFDCGPAVTKAVKEYLRSPSESLADYILWLGTSKQGGTLPKAIAEHCRSCGLRVVSHTMTMDDLDGYTRGGWPVICPVQRRNKGTAPEGHYVVVRGLDDESVHVHDPLEGRRKVARADFLRAWVDRDKTGRTYNKFGIAVNTGQGTSDDEPADLEAADDQETTQAAASALAGPVKKKVETDDVAGSHKDADKVQELLNLSEREGIATLAEVSRSAVKRVIDRIRQNVKDAGGWLRGLTRIFNDQEREQIAEALAKVNGTANLFGQARVHLLKERAESAEARGVKTFSDEPVIHTFADQAVRPLAPEAAVAYFTSLVPSFRTDPGVFGETMRRQAFTLAATTDLRVLNRVKRVIAQALQEGTVSGAPKQIQEILNQAGVSVSNPQYPEMVFRTNMMDSYTQGQAEAMRDPDVSDYFPVWQYMGIKDGRQGDDHEPQFGKFWPNTVSFQRVRGPRLFNCRCVPRSVSKFELRELLKNGVTIETTVPEHKSFSEEDEDACCAHSLSCTQK